MVVHKHMLLSFSVLLRYGSPCVLSNDICSVSVVFAKEGPLAPRSVALFWGAEQPITVVFFSGRKRFASEMVFVDEVYWTYGKKDSVVLDSHPEDWLIRMLGSQKNS